MKRFLIIFFCLASIFVLAELKYVFTKGFSLRKITYLADYKKENETDQSFLKDHLDIFDQEYFYLGKGRQAYVFESKDQKYVIKFMRYHKYQNPFWSEILTYFNFKNPLLNICLHEKVERYDKAIASYKIACRELFSITNVKYLHLNQTYFLNKKLKVINSCGQQYLVDLDKVGFIVQDKAEGLSDAFLKMIKDKDEAKIKALIDSFFEALVLKIRKSIINFDYSNMIRNAGYYQGRFVENDIGSFSFAAKDNSSYLKQQFLNYANEFKLFLEKYSPEYLSLFEEKLEKETLWLF